MTELASAPDRVDDGTLRRITHWIDGGPVAGTSGRTGRVFNGIGTILVDGAL